LKADSGIIREITLSGNFLFPLYLVGEKKSRSGCRQQTTLTYFYGMLEFIIIVLVVLAMAGFSMNKKK